MSKVMHFTIFVVWQSQKKRPKKYAEKVKTDKSFMELVKIAVNYKPKKADAKTA